MVISMFGVKSSSKQVCGGKVTQCSQLCGHRFLSLSLPKSFPKSSKLLKISILSYLSTQGPFPFKMYQFKKPRNFNLSKFFKDESQNSVHIASFSDWNWNICCYFACQWDNCVQILQPITPPLCGCDSLPGSACPDF